MGHPETVHLDDEHWQHVDRLIEEHDDIENPSQALKRVVADHAREYPHI